MTYIKVINELNNISGEQLDTYIAKLEQAEKFSDEEIKLFFEKTVGVLFSASKDVKAEELYRVDPQEEQPETYDSFWKEKDGYISFCTDPITPFIDSKVEKGSIVTLLTYRKISNDNPLALMVEGFPEDSAVFNILESDGLTENGRQNYLKICSFIKREINKNKCGAEFAAKVRSVLEEETKAYCYSISESEHYSFKPEYVKIYYCCTSSIACRLISIEEMGEKVQIMPIKHNNSAIIPGRKVEYDSFGEVGLFTFEMDDYRSKK